MKYLFVFFVVFVSACGGGGSSSGGGGGAVTAANPFAGSYTGLESLETTASDLPTIAGDFPVLIVIQGSGSVTITDGDGVEYSGQMSGATFTASGSQSGFTLEDAPGVTCAIEGTYDGAITNGVITGNKNGSVSCEMGSVAINVPFTGTYEANAEGATMSRQRAPRPLISRVAVEAARVS